MRITAALPPGATLDLSFLTPGTLDPLITFTRASTATYFDATGTMQTAAVNTPRWDYDPVAHVLNGLLLEDQRTNLLLNSAALGTQSVAVTAQLYTLSFYGTGTITKSGAATGALVGTGAFPQRVSQSFTPTAGTLTLTVTGSVLNAQLEALQDFPTSYIPTTVAAVTRNIDICQITPANMALSWFVPPGGTWFAEFRYFDPTPTGNPRVISRSDIGSGGLTPCQITPTNQVAQFEPAASTVTSATVVSANTVVKAASTWAAGQMKICVNGGAVASSAVTASGYAVYATAGVSLMTTPATPPAGNFTSGHLRRVRYWPRVLADAELQSVTT